MAVRAAMQPGATARIIAPTAVTQRRDDSRIVNRPRTLGTPTTTAIVTSGRTAAVTSTSGDRRDDAGSGGAP